MLKRKGLWERIDEILWAVEGEDESPGARVAVRHGVKLAPFFVVRDEDGTETVVTSALRLVRQYLDSAPAVATPADAAPIDLAAAARDLEEASPLEILRFGLESYGERSAIAFSGAEDVVLVDMATSLGLPFSVFTLDTGRLHNETYQFIDDVRRHYGVEIETLLPNGAEVSDLMSRKGPNSFYQDGHWECCSIRKLRPLDGVLSRFDAWVTGKRREGRPANELPVVHADPSFRGESGSLARLNPLARWAHVDVFDYIRRHGVPTNPLHDRGFAKIGCAPCTRARTGSPDEADRWWWEERPAEPAAPDPGAGI
ncbi:MAG: phosphoadenylyl-sulfate reductase [Deltaproteobacteria bacterium]|nr:phosphoadenylyl-sulfate reductase [Deltaproteobacteria bacterium]MBW2362360.1 phosphoadenylyl-sulfate reductase [Deltaproteobacteria bacterium]